MLGNYFVIVFTNVISTVSHLQYIAISILNPTIVTANADIASAYISAPTLSWDGVVFSNNLYIAYNTTSGGQSVKITYLSISQASVGGASAAATTLSGSKATIIGLCVDSTVNNTTHLCEFLCDSLSADTGYTAAVNVSLNTFLAATNIIPSGTILNLTSSAQNGICTTVRKNVSFLFI